MSFSHMIILGIIALIVIPPEKLPEMARQVARLINDFRRNTSGLWDDLKSEAMFKPEDLMKPNKPAETYTPSVNTQTINSEPVQTVAKADDNASVKTKTE